MKKNNGTNHITDKSIKKPMKNIGTFILLGCLGVLLMALIIIIPGIGKNLNSSTPQKISVNEAYEKYQTGAFFLDVRESDEWAEYHIPNTTHIPLGTLQRKLAELPKDQEIIVVCRSGNRSQTGRDILQKAGFEKVSSMNGGLKEWITAGYPNVSGE